MNILKNKIWYFGFWLLIGFIVYCSLYIIISFLGFLEIKLIFKNIFSKWMIENMIINIVKIMSIIVGISSQIFYWVIKYNDVVGNNDKEQDDMEDDDVYSYLS